MLLAGGGGLIVALVLLGVGLAVVSRPGDGPRSTATISTASGERLAFEPPITLVDAPGTVDITFRNRSNVAHNLVFVDRVTAATQTIVAAGTADELAVRFASPGAYEFVCTIHEGMTGRVVVESSALE